MAEEIAEIREIEQQDDEQEFYRQNPAAKFRRDAKAVGADAVTQAAAKLKQVFGTHFGFMTASFDGSSMGSSSRS